mmetsp:Transcript_25480/g.85593  ORF Transcript_25480/g.85593 Transcript_25480/m.85593 type:complete len:110 (-) Transcript_25480:1290-1619(-)
MVIPDSMSDLSIFSAVSSSHADVGSSRSSTKGSKARATASAARWASPPDNVAHISSNFEASRPQAEATCAGASWRSPLAVQRVRCARYLRAPLKSSLGVPARVGRSWLT